jgi:hypothetical protein
MRLMPPAPDGPDPADALNAGLAVFPLPPGGKVAQPGQLARATTDLEVLVSWWRTGDNIGIGCRASDVVGIDLDRHPSKPDGVARFRALCTAHAGSRDSDGWPHTLTVATPTGGRHLYFRAGGHPITSISGGVSALGPGIDTRGPGYRTGGRYTIVNPAPITDLPAWLFELLVYGRRLRRHQRPPRSLAGDDVAHPHINGDPR